MNSLLRPFPILISVVSLSIVFLTVAVADWHIQVSLYGANEPGDPSTPLSEGRIYQLPSRTTYLTYTDGQTNWFGVDRNDVLNISRPDYIPVVLTLKFLSTTVRQIGVTLFQNRTTQPSLVGQVSMNGLPLRDITVNCEGCTEQTTVITDAYGRYSLAAGGSSQGYTLRFIRSSNEVATIKINPETNDDHAKIDVVFDDSSPLMNFLRPWPRH